MKQFVWLRHNSVMLINYCVISLMLWLTISFMTLALKERDQSNLLQYSVDVQRKIFAAGIAVSQNESESEFRIAIDSMMSAIQNLTEQENFDLHSKASRVKVENVTAQLKEQLSEYDSLREISSNSFSIKSTLNETDTPTDSSVSDQVRKIQSTMIALLKSSAVQPNTNASDVSVLQGIIVEATTARFELSQSQAIVYGQSPADGSDAVGVNFLSNKSRAKENIHRNIRDIVSLSSSLDPDTQIVAQSNSLQSWVSRNSLWPYTDSAVTSKQQKKTFNEFSKQIESIVHSASSDLSNFAKIQQSRSHRNILIDIGLLLLSLVVAMTTFTLNRRVKYLAYSDHLTGLANRVSLDHWMCKSLESGSSKHKKHALISLNLDRFKSVNDNYGHDFGDELLKVIAKRLVDTCDSENMKVVVSRLGGGDFSLYVQDINSDEQVMRVANRLIGVVAEDVTIHKHIVRIEASAGVSFYPEDSNSGLALLKNADTAMFHNKAQGSNAVHRFDTEVAKSYERRLQIELDLKNALKNDEFELHYQPKVSMESGEVDSVEALLRWNSSNSGSVSPFEFIPVAEELSLMEDIGTWVLNKACEETAMIHRSEGLDYKLAVNISMQQFRDERFTSKIFNALEANGLKSKQLELEVTESLLMYDQDRVIAILHGIREAGVKVAIDDFGTGFSSLQYLQKLPLDTLKIDRAFILALDNYRPEESVANSIVQLAGLFNLDTVAEGVETVEQEEKVRSLGVGSIQGYLYSKPVPASELAAVIRKIPARVGSDSGNDYANADAA